MTTLRLRWLQNWSPRHDASPPSSGLTTSWQHQATERLPDPVLLIGSAGTVESCNQAARLHFGLELTTRPYAELVAPESAEPLGAAVAGVLRGESPADTRLNYHTTAGFQPMESRFYPFTENSWVQNCIVSSTVGPSGNGYGVTTGNGVTTGDGDRAQHLLEGLTDAFFHSTTRAVFHTSTCRRSGFWASPEPSF